MSSPTSRKAAIEAAARRLFAEQGYEATSMRAIAEEAGVSVGLAYTYFDGKEDLLRAVVQAGIRQIETTFEALDGPAAPSSRLDAFVHARLDTVRSHRPLWQVLYQLRQQPTAMASVRDRVDAVMETIFVRLTVLMKELGSSAPELDARRLSAEIDGAAQHYVRDPGAYPLDAVAGRIIDQFRSHP